MAIVCCMLTPSFLPLQYTSLSYTAPSLVSVMVASLMGVLKHELIVLKYHIKVFFKIPNMISLVIFNYKVI